MDMKTRTETLIALLDVMAKLMETEDKDYRFPEIEDLQNKIQQMEQDQ